MAMTSIPALHDTKYDPARRGKGTKLAVALAVLFFLLASCRPGHYPQALLVADSLCAAHPQRALEWLDSLRPRMEQERKGVRMYYDLLCIKAQDKAYMPHTSDSLIQAVLHYYEERADRRHLPEAYYYAGRVASDLGDAPQALDYFGKALEAMPEGAMTDLRSRVVSQMGMLFARQGMYADALEMYKQSLCYSEHLNDTLGVIYSLRDIAYAHRCLGQNDSVQPYYTQAYQWSIKWGDQELIQLMNIQIASYYLDREIYDSVYTYLPHDFTALSGENRNAAYAISSYYYEALGRQDSATYYYKMLFDNGDIYDKEVAARYLMRQVAPVMDRKQVAIAQEIYLRCADSVQYLTQTESVARMHSLYNYGLRERESARMQQAYTNQTKNLLILSCCLIGCLLVFILYREFQRQNRQIWVACLKKWRQWKDKLEDDHRKQQREYGRKIHVLENNLAEERQQGKAREEELQNNILELQRQMTAFRMLKEEQLSDVQETSIYKALKKKLLLSHQGKAKVSKQEWKELEETIQKCDDSFLQKLKSLDYHFQQTEWQICLLLKAGFTPSQIGILLEGISVQTISTKRKRMAERLLDSSRKSPKDWDDFIHSL